MSAWGSASSGPGPGRGRQTARRRPSCQPGRRPAGEDSTHLGTPTVEGDDVKVAAQFQGELRPPKAGRLAPFHGGLGVNVGVTVAGQEHVGPAGFGCHGDPGRGHNRTADAHPLPGKERCPSGKCSMSSRSPPLTISWGSARGRRGRTDRRGGVEFRGTPEMGSQVLGHFPHEFRRPVGVAGQEANVHRRDVLRGWVEDVHALAAKLVHEPPPVRVAARGQGGGRGQLPVKLGRLQLGLVGDRHNHEMDARCPAVALKLDDGRPRIGVGGAAPACGSPQSPGGTRKQARGTAHPDPRPAVVQFQRDCRAAAVPSRGCAESRQGPAAAGPAENRQLAFTPALDPGPQPGLAAVRGQACASEGVGRLRPNPEHVSPVDVRFLACDTHWTPEFIGEVAPKPGFP